MADRDLRSHHVDQIIEISTMHYVRQHRSVHLFVLRPVRAVQVWHIEIIALVAPAFVEDLFEFFLGIEIHAKINVEPAGARLWRDSICVNDEEGRSRRRATGSRPGSATTATRGAINQLAPIRTDFVNSNSADE